MNSEMPESASEVDGQAPSIWWLGPAALGVIAELALELSLMFPCFLATVSVAPGGLYGEGPETGLMIAFAIERALLLAGMWLIARKAAGSLKVGLRGALLAWTCITIGAPLWAFLESMYT